MEILLFYALFALTTAFASEYELMMPIMHKRKQEKGVIENEILLYITFFFFALLLAPYFFFACIHPETSLNVRVGLSEGLFPKD